MAELPLKLKVIRSHSDESIYNLYLALPKNSGAQTLLITVKQGDFLSKDDALGELTTSKGIKSKFIMPFSGTILERASDIDLLKAEGVNLLLFAIRICQHEPQVKKQIPNINNLSSKPIIKTRLKCRFCKQEIWYYYNTIQKEITLQQFQSKFDNLDLKNVQWKVILNQSFTKNTQVASNEQDTFFINATGKITFLQDLYQLSQQQNSNLDHVILRYKEVICNHERLANGICQFCLTPIKDIGLQDLKLYLFQMDSEMANSEVIIRGRALSDQEKMFKGSLIQNRKALLILDLDNTILHSVQYWKVQQEALEMIGQHVILSVKDLKIPTFKTIMKIRPYFEEFLKSIVPNYQIFVYTKGTRLYADMVCLAIREKYLHILQGTKNFLPFRVISRDEDPDLKKKLTYILPTLKDFLVILDDRRDVWDHSPYCIYTKPYHFFYRLEIMKQGEVQFKEVNWDKGGGSLGEIQQNLADSAEQNNEKSQENSQRKKQNEESQCGIKVNIENQLQKEQGKIKLPAQVQNQKVENKELKNMNSENGRFEEKLKKQSKPKICFSDDPDYYLLYAAFTMNTVHQLYFQSINQQNSRPNRTGIYSDMSFIYKKYRKSLLSNVTAKFLISNPILEKRATLLGIIILPLDSPQTPEIVIRPNLLSHKALDGCVQMATHKQYHISHAQQIQLHKKLKNLAQTIKLPIISQSWISFCYEYTYGFPYEHFVLDQPQAIDLLKEDKRFELNRALTTLEEITPKIKSKLGI